MTGNPLFMEEIEDGPNLLEIKLKFLWIIPEGGQASWAEGGDQGSSR